MEVTVPESSEKIVPLLMSRAEVCRFLGIGPTSLWHLRQRDDLPKFVRIVGRKLGVCCIRPREPPQKPPGAQKSAREARSSTQRR